MSKVIFQKFQKKKFNSRELIFLNFFANSNITKWFYCSTWLRKLVSMSKCFYKDGGFKGANEDVFKGHLEGQKVEIQGQIA